VRMRFNRRGEVVEDKRHINPSWESVNDLLFQPRHSSPARRRMHEKHHAERSAYWKARLEATTKEAKDIDKSRTPTEG